LDQKASISDKEITASSEAKVGDVAASFRDPDGYCAVRNGRVFRFVYSHAVDRVRQLIESEFFADLVRSNKVPRTWVLPPTGQAAFEVPAGPDASATKTALVLEQERIPFVSYPHEWCPEMLYAAGQLTLELQLDALRHGLMLKDATPFNVQFHGSRPVFVDILSFVARPSGTAIWPAYAQFIRTFVLPLFENARFGLGTHSIFLARPDGLAPGDVYCKLSWIGRLRPAALKVVSIPFWLEHTTKAQKLAPATIKRIPEDFGERFGPFSRSAENQHGLGTRIRRVTRKIQHIRKRTWSALALRNGLRERF
jgi:hypothetical protein